MKKVNYFAPTIEVVEMVVENGIAASLITGGENFGGVGDDGYGEGTSNFGDANNGNAIW